MSAAPLTHLRYVGIGVPNYQEAVDFYGGIWGLQPVADDSGVTFFGMPATPEQYSIRVRQSDDKRLDIVGFGVGSTAEVDTIAERVIAAGAQVDREPTGLQTPGGGYGVRFFDPDGRLIEVSADVATKETRDLEPRESIPAALSHVVFNSTDLEGTRAFYQDVLGFRLSDWLEDFMCFLRINSDHHSLAIAKGPANTLNHISFQMRGIDEYLRGTGRMLRGGHDLLWGPGRHGAGDNTFSYFSDPTGNVIEYTTELEKVDEATWEPRVWEATPEAADHWGTSRTLMTEQLLPHMMSQTNGGLWQSSPV